MIEIWQANAAGRYAHPADDREEIPLETGFTGFGRSGTESDGSFAFVTVKPGRVPWVDGRLQAPHLLVGVFARGLLKRVATRMYFPDEETANAEDPVLLGLEPAERTTLVARAEDGALRFDIVLQGAGRDDILRGVTPFSAIFVPEGAARGGLGSRVAAGDARRGARPREGGRRSRPRPG